MGCHVEKPSQTCKPRGLRKKTPTPSRRPHPTHKFVRSGSVREESERLMEEEIRSSSPPPAALITRRKQERSALSRVKKDCLWFTASMQEGFANVKAFFFGLTKKVTARNEKEATEADLKAAKMQVEAADAAEETKKRLDKTM